MAFADEQPIGMRALQRACLLDIGNGDDLRGATGARVGGEGEGTKDVDDDRDASGSAGALDEIGYTDQHTA